MTELLKYIYTSLPMISSLTCGMLFIIAYGQELTKVEQQVKKILSIYFAFIVFSWVYVQFYFVYEYRLKYFIPLVCFVLQLNQVLFYHFICLLTPIEKQNRLQIRMHYVVPLLFLLVSGIFMITFTKINQLSDEVISLLFLPYSYLSVFFFMLFYVIVGSIRIIRYKKRIIKAYGVEKWKIMRWMELMMLLRFLVSILFIFNPLELDFILVIIAILVPIQHVVIVYNILMRNYMILSFGTHHTVMITGGEIISLTDKGNDLYSQLGVETSTLLTKTELEQYYASTKPYLDADFKMQRLVEHFDTNRTYLSGFINRTFGVNFSQYNNLWRLKEMEYLQEKPENKEKNKEELALMAGFSNSRSYWRAKKYVNQKDDNNKK